MISVLSAESLAAPREMFDFYVAEGIEQVCFNVEESEGDHVSRSLRRGRDRRRLLPLSQRVLAAVGGLARQASTSSARSTTRTQQVLRPQEAGFFNQLVEPFAITSMDWPGNIATFSPELLGLKNADYDDFIIGNINRDRLVDLPQRPVLARMLADIDAGVALCRESCEYFSVCGGGEPVNKLSENGSFVSTETTYCRMTKMRATDLVLDLLERSDSRWAICRRRRSARSGRRHRRRVERHGAGRLNGRPVRGRSQFGGRG